MLTMITNCSEKELKHKTVTKNGITTMVDKTGREWVLAGSYDTKELAEKAQKQIHS